jgi:predicted dehydrogenase
MNHLNRRDFLAASAFLAAGASTTSLLSAAANDDSSSHQKLRACVIGHTGRGDYGHGLDVVFTGHPQCELVGLADPDEAGRAKAVERTKAPKSYADYREMLAKEKPQIVAVAPRQTDQHVAMALAAFEVGAHVIMEKPIASSCAEADQILAAADGAKRRIAVAHQMRIGPRTQKLKKALDEGLIGELLQLDAYGKQDAKRAGGEDMMVLGTHEFDLMRFFAGDVRSCTARVLQKGHEITKADARTPGEAIGPVAGDEIFAQFAFDKGVNGTFTSRARMRETAGHWGIMLTGSKGMVRILTEVEPHVLVCRPTGDWQIGGRVDEWLPLGMKPGPAENDFAAQNRRVLDDLLDAIRTDREPVCSGRNAAKAVEMVMAVYAAALGGSRVTLPLADRKHPLA